jgi:hypothetical protein
MERKAFEDGKRVRESKIASSTPMMEVLGVTPKVVMICIPMIAPRTARITEYNKVAGSRVRG